MDKFKEPAQRPANNRFSSGPCTKHKGWQLSKLDNALLGRSHRSNAGKSRLASAIDKTRNILKIPENYLVGIVPASDTGAVEMALWSLLGPRGVHVMAWESFGKVWVTDVVNQLDLVDVKSEVADFGKLPDLSSVDFKRDVIFTWNGTTSGVRVPNGDWIAADREGLTICDATSAAFAQYLDWLKLDVVTYSWQKVLGGEAQHGMLILSPRAVERLESYSPPWPMPKLFRMTKNGKLNWAIFQGETINTPSMLCLEDYLDALDWADDQGGLDGLVGKADRNAAVISKWVGETDWVDFVAEDPGTRSNTSVCLKIVDPVITALSDGEQIDFAKSIVSLLDKKDVAKDIGSYRDAPPGLRVWTGATVEQSDVEALMPWLDWAFVSLKNELIT